MNKTSPLYPQVEVAITGNDGNAFAVIGACSVKAKRAGVPADRIAAFQSEAMSGDYSHLLRTCMKWFDVS